MEYVMAIVLGVIGSLIATELAANGPAFAEWLIRRAVRKLPESERARYAEEWLADIGDYSGPLQKVFRALGITFSIRALRKGFLVPTRAIDGGPNKQENNRQELMIGLHLVSKLVSEPASWRLIHELVILGDKLGVLKIQDSSLSRWRWLFTNLYRRPATLVRLFWLVYRVAKISLRLGG